MFDPFLTFFPCSALFNLVWTPGPGNLFFLIFFGGFRARRARITLVRGQGDLEKVQGATRLGATGLRASERKSASERVSERTSENL